MDLRANRVVKTGAQAFVINWELFEIGTAVIKATKDHQLGRKYIPPRQVRLRLIDILFIIFDFEIICLS